MTLTEDELARPLTAEEEAKYFAYWFDPARTSPPSSMDVDGVRRLLATLAALRVTPVADTAGIDAAWREAEAALPEGWDLWLAATGPGFMAWANGPGEVSVRAWSQADPELLYYDPNASPAAALLALAAALRTPRPEGDPE